MLSPRDGHTCRAHGGPSDAGRDIQSGTMGAQHQWHLVAATVGTQNRPRHGQLQLGPLFTDSTSSAIACVAVLSPNLLRRGTGPVHLNGYRHGQGLHGGQELVRNVVRT